MNGRRGMALLATLWVIVALAALAAAVTQQARAGSAVSADRVSAIRGRWAAEGCLALAQSRIEQRLRRQEPALRADFDTVFYANGVACRTEATDSGARIHRDSADPATLALLDTVLAGSGANETRDDHLTSYGDGRVNLMTADAHVLATLPGFGDEAIRVTLHARQWGRPLSSLDDVVARIPAHSRRAFMHHYPALIPRTTVRTGFIVLRASAWTDAESQTATIELLTVPSGNRLAITERHLQ